MPRAFLLPVLTVAVVNAPPAAPTRQWHWVDGAHWQLESTEMEARELTDAREGTRGACPTGMVDVEGEMAMDEELELLQDATCTEWISRAFPERCARFDAGRWSVLLAGVPRRHVHFCIDRFEYPNELGAFPWIMVTGREAAAVCAREGKRLCTEDEWTFACEGEGALPYPYGFERDATACVIDRPSRGYHSGALRPRGGERTRVEIDRLWQGEASGSNPRCRSPFGVYDMTGNVDEWTTSVATGGRRSILKGGYWGPVRVRCRPSTRAHGQDFAFYQIGFRCCANAPP